MKSLGDVLHEIYAFKEILSKTMEVRYLLRLMASSKITVYRSSPYVIEKKPTSAFNQKEISITFEELRGWVSSGKILSHLFRYKESIMVSQDLQLLSKPFASALLMWALARNKTVRNDKNGTTQKINIPFLTSLLFKLIKDLFRKNKFLKAITEEVNVLFNNQNKEKRTLDLTKPPLYLRTDFCFGLQSGGSVGHIAGVLNNLSHFSEKPIFLTTDRIPTVSQEWEAHIVKPGKDFWDYSELPPLHFNRVFFDKALSLVGDRPLSFIYQRYSINNFAGAKLANHYRIPFVLEFNGSEIWVNRHWGGSILKYEALAEKIELLSLRASDLIVVVSQPLKDQLIAKGIDSNKILVNPNGVNPEKYSPSIDGSKVRKTLHFENKTVLGFIGTFGKWHGAEILAEAFGMLLHQYPELRNRVQLLMIGNGMTLPSVKESLEKWKVADLCTLTGIIPQEEGPSHLAACDILVSPHVPNEDGSPFFGSPTKLFEYMAMGKGIVASDLDQIGEILEHNKTAYMVKPGDAKSLMMGLKAMIDDQATRNRLGQAAREKVVSDYTWKEHTRKIIDKIRSLS